MVRRRFVVVGRMKQCSGTHHRFRGLPDHLRIELDQLTARIEEMDVVMEQTGKENEACQRLTTIPGIGPVTTTALVAASGHCGIGKQTTRNGVGRSLEKRNVSDSDPGSTLLSPDWV